MTAAQRRGLNDAVTRMWSFLAPAYDLPFFAAVGVPPAARRGDRAAARPQLSQDRRCRLRYGHSQRSNRARIGSRRGLWRRHVRRHARPGPRQVQPGALAARPRPSSCPFDDGALDAVVTTSAFHFFDQPAALREFHRVLASGGLVAVSALSTRRPRPQSPADNRWKPQHNASPAEMRSLFEGAGFTVSDQHRIQRPVWTRIVSDLITVGTKS